MCLCKVQNEKDTDFFSLGDFQVPEPTGNDAYEVCDPDDGEFCV